MKFFNQLKNKLFYSKLIKKDDFCIDIGANIGKKSKIFLALGAKVIAFEPQNSCKTSLEKIKQSYKNFDYYTLAVGSNNRTDELHLANHIEVATLSNKFIKFYTTETIFWDKKEKVVVSTLNDIITKHGIPDYCKIDTEGSELEILSSLSYKIPMIEFEFTEGFFKDTIKIIDLFKPNESLFNFTLNEKTKFELNKWTTAEEFLKVFLNLPKKRVHGNIFIKTDVNK